ncbi:MAG: AAA family ATPase [Thermaerobacterales bacterium]
MKRDAGIGIGLGVVSFLLLNGRGLDMIPLLLLGAAVAVAIYINSQRGGGLSASLAGGAGEDAATRIRFEDVGGQETAKREMLEALDFLNDPESVSRLGIRPLRGILLTGPPGTGKTMLAKAAAGYTNSLFMSVSGSEFVEMYAGVGAQRVRGLFRRAKEQARAQKKDSTVVFIDEIEVLGGKRGRHASHLEYDQTLNQLLVEMDGMTSDDDVAVVIIAATNRLDLIDDALLRPGRFDRIVQVSLPDREGRRKILSIHCDEKPLAPDVDLDNIARETFGFSGAHLESLGNEAAILAWRESSSVIGHHHLMEAVDKVMLGEKLERKPLIAEKHRIAVHEAGHALIGELLNPDSVASITITSRGAALGYVRRRPEADWYLQTQQDLEYDICIALAGHAAERLVLGSPSTGAAGDFRQAMALASRMIEAGMSPLGVVAVEHLPQGTLFDATREILNDLGDRVMDLLQQQADGLDRLTAALLEAESLDGEQVRIFLRSQDDPGNRRGEVEHAQH